MAYQDDPKNPSQHEVLIRKSIREITRLRAELEKARTQSSEPIAIIGIGCRAPGGVQDAEAYWQLLDGGRDAVGPFPARWDADSLYDPDPDAAGKSYAREGGFLSDVDRFDAGFFGIAPREALAMDPQQRLVLEVTWEALERAGIRPAALNETSTGVYLGSVGADYGQSGSASEALDGYFATGTAASVLSGRVSYVLGLQGPALTVDTACSSSLVALHLACSGLRQGECDLALAGGVQVMSTPALFVEFSRLRGLAPDARCKAFSADADGVGWAEGCSVLVLKRLSDAERDGDRVLAVLRGSAVNQDGRSQGLTAPNGPSQQRVIRQALRASGLTPDDIDAVEAHGTGTTLGDPIEAGALAAVFGATRDGKDPVYLGSCKSNLGHASAAAGVLGLVKLVLALQHERLPKTLHAERPSAHVDWEASGLRLLQQPRAWPRRDARVRRAGVSSFGFSGTNAHLIVEEAPARPAPAGEASALAVPLLLSGRDQAALRAQAERWADWLHANGDCQWSQVLRTAAAQRTHFDARAALSVQSATDAAQALRALAEDKPHRELLVGRARALGGVVFVFPGQGSQWPAMGRELWEQCDAFRAAISACDAALSPHTGWSVAAVVRGEQVAAAPATRVDVVQPALFAMGVALAAVWRSLGVTPSAVIGTSQGEVAAAVVAGALSLEDGARIVALRCRLLVPLAGTGGMAVVELPVDAVEALLREERSALCVAGVNVATSTIVAGDSADIDAFVARRTAQGVFCRRVDVDYASHSGHMDVLLPALREQLAGVAPRASSVPMVSTLTGALVAGSELDADYWCRNLRQPVRLDLALRALQAREQNVFVEVSAHPVLAIPLTSACAQGTGATVGSLSRDAGGLRSIYRALGALHVQGYAVGWEALTAGAGGVELPTYAFQRQRYWLEERRSALDIPSLGLSPAEHPMLRVVTRLADGEGLLFSGRVSLAAQPWLADHALFEHVVLPGTGLLELALAAGAAAGVPRLQELTLAAPLALSGKAGARVQIQLEPADAEGQRALRLHGRSDADPEEAPWTLHASGVLVPAAEPPSVVSLEWPPRDVEAIDVAALYASFGARGVAYGPSFQGLQAVWRAGQTLWGEVTLPDAQASAAGEYALHPALFDAALHMLAAAASAEAAGAMLLPYAWSDVTLHALGARTLRVRLELAQATPEQVSASLSAFDEAGQPVVTVGSLQLRRATAAQLRSSLQPQLRDLYRVSFQHVPLGESQLQERALVLGGGGRLAELLGAAHVPDLAALSALLDAGEAAPARLILDKAARRALERAGLPGAVLAETCAALAELQQLLAEPRLAQTALLWVTCGALSSGPDDGVHDLPRAPLWGLLRTARNEHPDRVLRAIDLDRSELGAQSLRALLAADTESELAWRHGVALAPRLESAAAARDTLELPAQASAFQISEGAGGRLSELRLVDAPHLLEPLASGQVRVAISALGLNFLDVVRTLGLVELARPLLPEAAGTVVEVGPDVSDLWVGERVMGLLSTSGGCLGVADARLLVRIPSALSFAQAASLPVNVGTAWFGLCQLGQLERGERVLIHAAAGGTGMAALQLARHLGAEVFATASRSKWPILRALGIADDHIASSRDTEFLQSFLAVTGGAGVDVVLNSLAGEFVDASLKLLPRGGRFLEMGKTDIRDPQLVRATHPGVAYRAFDLAEPGPDGLRATFSEVASLFERGVLSPIPLSAYDLRDAPSAFKFMGNGRNVGKVVLQIPRALDPQGTVLITGGSGELGAALARHLVAKHGVRHLLLASRSGERSAAAAELSSSLAALGAHSIVFAACDVGDREQLARLLEHASVRAHPLTGVFHLAGVLDDSVVSAMSSEQLARVLRPKVAGAWHLHELTEQLELSAFVLFSSAAGVLGGAGQANYAAANAFLDALAAERRKRGLPAQSLAWGLWQPHGAGMTAHLGKAELLRMQRAGFDTLSVDQGLALFDAARARPEAGLVPASIDLARLRRLFDRGSAVAPLLRSLIRPSLRRVEAGAASASSLRLRLAKLPEAQRQHALVTMVQEVVAAVLGLSGASAVPEERPLKELGLDSLMAVEVRNQLTARTESALPATLVFDYPTPKDIATLLLGNAFGQLDDAACATAQRATSDEPIAIVGMACRTPGGVVDVEGYWSLLAEGRDGVGPFPQRWDSDADYDRDPDAQGDPHAREGGFLRDVERFDAGFFGIAPREAEAMDPQQRLVLEVSWEALERAGLRPGELNGTSTGVYLGSVGSDYSRAGGAAVDELAGYLVTGHASSVLSGRVSYTLGLQGPAITVDTACSSSLVALHLACTALRHGECELALAGGVQVMCTPAMFREFSRLRGLASDGRCKPFAAAADGTGWAEGCGVLVLKRLSDAQRDADRILAVIRGSAINQDGRSQGLTAPNGPSQQRVIRLALSASGLAPTDIDAVEAHGTGTTLGDPIEAGALAAVFGPTRAGMDPVWLGSSKSNLGHAQAAAGVLGLIKMVLALEHELVPRTLHVDRPSDHVQWEGSGLCLAQEARAWPRRPDRVRRAGVSSFGFSGTNAHVIVEEPPARGAQGALLKLPAPLLLSGRDERALREQAERWASWLADHPGAAWADLVSVAARRRTHLAARAALVVEDAREAERALTALSRGQSHAALVRGHCSGGALAMLFSGQGSQHLGMGRELYGQPGFEAFSQAFDELARALDAHLERPLAQLMWSDSAEASALAQTRFTQPALFALEVALYRQWQHWGVRPQLLLGHSVGELACAHVAGVLSLADAAALVCARGRLMDELATAGGAMASLEASQAEVEALIAEAALVGKLEIAGLNAPRQTVVSGDREAVQACVQQLRARGRKGTLLEVSHAFHSAHMDAMLDAFRRLAEGLVYAPPSLSIVSNLTGQRADIERGELVTADYWVRHLREAVRFREGVEAAVALGANTFLECGPQGRLCALVAACLQDAGEAGFAASLRKGQPETGTMLAALAAVHVHGHAVAWEALIDGDARVDLPSYAFQRDRYWWEARPARSDVAAAGLAAAEHPLLRAATSLAHGQGVLFTGYLSRAQQPWLSDHRVFDSVLLPGTALVELALAAGRAIGSQGLAELTLSAPLVLPERDAVRVQLHVEAADGQAARAFSLHSRADSAPEDAPWTLHASGLLTAHCEAPAAALREWPPAGATPIDVSDLYGRLAGHGFHYGPAFQGLRAAFRLGNAVYAEVALAPEQVKGSGEFGLHPALFDAALHALALLGSEDARAAGAVLPFAWSDVGLFAQGASALRVRAELSSADGGQLSASIALFDEAGEPLASIGSLELRRATAEQLRSAVQGEQRDLFQLAFQPVALAHSAGEERLVVVGGAGLLAQRLGAAQLPDMAALQAALDAGHAAPERVIFDASTWGAAQGELLASLHAASARALAELQALLAEPRLGATKAVWLTSSAISSAADDAVHDLAHAPLWGLARSARSEQPERVLRLVDVDDESASAAFLRALCKADAEPELVGRREQALAPRLQSLAASAASGAAQAQAAGTVLITGGLGELGRALARHLVSKRGVRRLLLLSRRGPDAASAAQLVADLGALGAEIVILSACDLTQREELARVIAAIDPAHPLTAVYHLAALLDDGVVTQLDSERLARVMRPKVDGAWHLHELTAGMDLSEFVLFSSVAGVLGGPGQANYAAANAFLDALAAQRVARGARAQSLAWGLWESQGAGLTAQLAEADLARMQRAGLRPLSVARGMELLELARARPAACVAPVALDLARLRRLRSAGVPVPALLRALVRPSLPRAKAASQTSSALRARLAQLPEAERLGALVSMVQEVVATTLNLTSAAAVPPRQPLTELGLDSLMAVEVRQQLAARAEVALPATLAFDYPTPEAIAKLLLNQAFAELTQAAQGAQPALHRSDEPIAIIGMACRTPGGVVDPEGYWQLLDEGRDAVGPFPSRWDTEALYDPDPDAPGKSYAREGGFLSDADAFDAAFFGIAPREALSMDPQQRLVLEVAWEALEHAGIKPELLHESSTGVYLGSMGSDYGQAGASLESLDGHTATGQASSVLSGRLSYTLGLQGPAMTVDTACSSSLVALHLACAGLRQGECDLALSGGVQIMSTPAFFIEFSRLRGLAPDGRCKSFSAQADGVGWSEGCGVLLLKRLCDAERDGDRILAVLRASAVNQDGRSQGLSAPNGPSQQRVIRRALAAGGLAPDDIDVVEAHGTGTALGDPIEAGALAAVFGPSRAAGEPLYLGSSKSNLGHTSAAAGVLGVMKMVLALQHERLPKTLHAETPSEHVAWPGSGLALLRDARPWPARAERPRRAGVSGFGVSGTNAHMIVEEAPVPAAPPASAPALAPLPLLVSGRDAAALRAQAARWASWLALHPETPFGELLRSAAVARTHFEDRAALLADDVQGAIALLRALSEERAHADLLLGKARALGSVVFVFPGQGSQWAAMGRALWDESAVFRAAVEACDAALAPHTGWSVAAVLRGQASEAPPATRVDVVQPALFTMGVALAAVWRSLGVEPSAVLGTSQGEVAAAVVCGALSLEDGARVVALRSQLLVPLAGSGGMAVVELPVEQVEKLLAEERSVLSVAGVNTPGSTIVSGDSAAIYAFVLRHSDAGVFCRRVDVDYASHSSHMDGLLVALRQQLSGLRPRASQVPMVSTLTGGPVSGSELDAEYWCRNLREPVRLDRALALLQQRNQNVFVEVSAHPVLAMPLTSACASSGGAVIGSLVREAGSLRALYRGLAALHVHGHPVAWDKLAAPSAHVDLPTYAFQRQRYWLEEQRRSSDIPALGLCSTAHAILRASTQLADGEGVLLSGRLSPADQPWVADHRVFDHVLFPGTGFVELALAAGVAVDSPRLAELALAAPLRFDGRTGLRIQIRVEAAAARGERTLQLYSRSEDAADDAPWVQNASGVLAAAVEGGLTPSAGEWPPAHATPIDLTDLYPRLASGGLGYGPAFRGLRAAWRREQTLFAEVCLPEKHATQASDYGVHPALFDAALHVLATQSPAGAQGAVLLPFVWSDVTLHVTSARALRVQIELTSAAEEHASATLAAFDELGQPVLTVGSLQLRRATREQLRAAAQSDIRNLYRTSFVPVALGAAPVREHAMVLGGFGVLPELVGAPHVPDVDAMRALLDAGDPLPERLLLDKTGWRKAGAHAPSAAVLAAAAGEATERALIELQALLAEPRLASTRLVWVTASALSSGADDSVDDLIHAPLWGLVRSARNERPDRVLRLLDLDRNESDEARLRQLACADGEAELVLRHGRALAPRLVAADPSEGVLTAPADTSAWRIQLSGRGSINQVGIVEAPQALAPLAPSQVRIRVRVAGVNFRDALNALGVVDAPWLGHEIAGEVLEVGAEVTAFAPGDRVMGLAEAAFSTTCISHALLLTRIPAHLTFAEAASVPLVFLTALYGLRDLAQLEAGERVLIHAGAGGVGMAAIQLARWLGAEVYATASAGKWSVLRALGVAEARIASSRDLGFEAQFARATAGGGVDVVLNALAGDFVDASLRLLPRGGRFLEMGKTDIRPAAEVAARFPAVIYQAYDLIEAGFERIQALLSEIGELLERRVLQPLPVSAYDLRQAPTALRHIATGRHVGKLVLRAPRALDAGGAVLITGGLGELGQALARQLVARHGVRHLWLTSRRGEADPAAAGLEAELRAGGAESVVVAACDVAERAQLEHLLAAIEAQRPLTGVFHLAGVLDDAVVSELTPERLQRVLRPKLQGALHLHELTLRKELAAFVLFSSAAGVMGGPGQANYAAANAFLDALAARRQKLGLAGQSLAWGLWEPQGTGMTAHLGAADLLRLRRAGIVPMPLARGMELLDAALLRPEALLVPMQLELAKLRRQHGAVVPALMRALVRPALRRAEAGSMAGSALRARLSKLPATERLDAVVTLVQEVVASVLGLSGPSAVPAKQPLKELGLDSLMAVEVRNQLSARAETILPATLVFDHPTPEAIAKLLLGQAFAQLGDAAQAAPQPRHASDEPIAIVGMSCRAPGGVVDPEGYWQLLAEGRDAVGPFPPRWDTDAIYDPDPDARGKSYAREGGFVRDVDRFDASFFGIGPSEALAMDPQQRMVLELSWEALERAGIDPEALAETSTGVYMGSVGSDYAQGSLDLEALDGYKATGHAASILSGRLAYVLGLQGPAMTVDTACSSSLVALHLACNGLRQGECDLAIAGGVQVMSTPITFIEFSRLRGMARDGRCKAFSAEADGAGWAEGCGVLVLKRLADAERDGDRILALVRSSAVNQDGRSQGLTAPNGPAQQRVIKRALASAGLAPNDIDAVEAHGTGTALGDPIEASALAAVFGPTRAGVDPVYLGSSKSNFGHAQAAAGVLGLMKMVLALEHEQLPKTLHAERPSPHVAWEGSGLALLREARPWPRRSERVRRAGLSSFGISGTNAHVILEEGPAQRSPARTPASLKQPAPLLLSSRDEQALRAQAGRLRSWLAAHPAAAWAEVVSAAALHRTQFEQRAALVVHDAAEASAALTALAEGAPHAAVARGRAHGGPLAVLFSGQGSQRLGMGRALYGQPGFEAFTLTFDEVCAACDAQLGRSLKALMWGEPGDPTSAALLADAGHAQPALFALEVALYRQWRAWGVRPKLLLGHSVGELAAAHVADVLTLADAAKLVCARGRLVQELESAAGAVASSSPQLQRKLDAFRALAAGLTYHEPTLSVVSNVTGRCADVARGELVSASYWVEQARRAPHFAAGVQTAFEAGVSTFLECGPRASLSGMVAECAGTQREVVLAVSLGEEQPEPASMLAAMGSLHVHGHALRWDTLIEGVTWADLPTYAFQGQSFWLRRDASTPELAVDARSALRSKSVDDLTTDDLREVLFRFIPTQQLTDDDSLNDKAGMDSLSLLKFLRGVQQLVGATTAPVPVGGTLSLANVLAGIRGAARRTPGEASAPQSELGQYRRSAWAPYVRQGITLQTTKVHWENGLELELFRFGEGPPLLLLPPFYCEAWAWWPAAQRLAASHTVYLINFPGYGGAAAFAGLPTPQLLARALASLRASSAASRSWTVCGWSYGGFVAQALLELDPANITRCVLVNTTACLELGESDGMQTLVRKVRADLATHLERSSDPSLRALVYGEQKLELFASYGSCIAGWDHRSARPVSSMPILIISVLDDTATPPYMMYEIHDRLPGSELRAIPRGGHYWPLFAPEQFVRVLERSIASDTAETLLQEED